MIPVTNREVKECLVLSDEGKNFENISLRHHTEKLKEKKVEVKSMDDSQIDAKIEDPRRIDFYNSFCWEIKEVQLEDLGVSPRMCFMPDYFCFGNVFSTSAYIKELLAGKRFLRSSEINIHTDMYIEKISKIYKLIVSTGEDDIVKYMKTIPIILYKGGTNRKDHRYIHCKWDIDDGSNRSVMFAISGMKKAIAYVGSPLT